MKNSAIPVVEALGVDEVARGNLGSGKILLIQILFRSRSDILYVCQLKVCASIVRLSRHWSESTIFRRKVVQPALCM